MTLATSVDKPWVATVYFVNDEDLNLYFVSSTQSKHCRDIAKNSKVACAIYDSRTLNSEKKVGVQLQGIASIVTSWRRIKVLIDMWNKAAPGAEDIINFKNLKSKVVGSKMYRVKPIYIKFFNEKLFGTDGVREYEL